MGIPGSEERNHHCMKFWWGFRSVGIPSSGNSGYIPFIPPCRKGGGHFFGIFGLKGVGSKNFGIKGEPKFAISNFYNLILK